MGVTSLNHVSIHAADLDASTRFYTDVLGLRLLPTPTFAFPVQWLAAGDRQLHLFEREYVPAPIYHHVAFDVDEFEPVWERSRDLGLQEADAFYSQIYELPDGAVQMYLRDPAGNLVEIDWPSIDSLDLERLPAIEKLSDSVAQDPQSAVPTLYHAKR